MESRCQTDQLAASNEIPVGANTRSDISPKNNYMHMHVLTVTPAFALLYFDKSNNLMHKPKPLYLLYIRFDLIRNSAGRMASDGLNTLNYKLLEVKEQPLYTMVTVHVEQSMMPS